MQWKQTGSTGFIRPRRGAPAIELVGASLFVVALALLVAVPVADLAGMTRIVRNPIFSAMLPAAAGLVLLVPDALGVVALAVLVTALEIQVRLVEESYLTPSTAPATSGTASAPAASSPASEPPGADRQTMSGGPHRPSPMRGPAWAKTQWRPSQSAAV